MDSTFSYIPFRALIEAPQMRRYHKKEFVVRSREMWRIAKETAQG
jgi:hypothetical protein